MSTQQLTGRQIAVAIPTTLSQLTNDIGAATSAISSDGSLVANLFAAVVNYQINANHQNAFNVLQSFQAISTTSINNNGGLIATGSINVNGVGSLGLIYRASSGLLTESAHVKFDSTNDGLDLSTLLGYIQFPTSNTAGLPSSPAEGWIRYNSQTHLPIYYNGSAWVSFAGSGGATAPNVVSKTANFTLTTANDICLVDATSGAVTITLPDPTTSTKIYTVKKIDSTTNTVIVVPPSGTIEFGSSFTIVQQGDSIDTFSNLTNYFLK